MRDPCPFLLCAMCSQKVRLTNSETPAHKHTSRGSRCGQQAKHCSASPHLLLLVCVTGWRCHLGGEYCGVLPFLQALPQLHSTLRSEMSMS